MNTSQTWARPGSRRSQPWGFATSVVALVLATAGCSSGPWELSSDPKLRVDVAGGCPLSLFGDQDVVNTYTGSKLVPADPTGGLICRYYPTGGLPSPTQGGQLAQETRLDSAEANELATAIRGSRSSATYRDVALPQ